MVCFIHRPEYYGITTGEDGADLTGVGEFIIAKHRNGPVGDVRLDFLGAYTRFQTRDPAKDKVQNRPFGGEQTARASFSAKGKGATNVASIDIKKDKAPF